MSLTNKISERGSPCFKPIETSKNSDKLKYVDLTHEDNLLFIDFMIFTNLLLIPSFSSFWDRGVSPLSHSEAAFEKSNLKLQPQSTCVYLHQNRVLIGYNLPFQRFHWFDRITKPSAA